MRWVRGAGRPRLETDKELADAFGVGEKWLDKWKRRDDAPDGKSEADAIEAVIGEQFAEWLYGTRRDCPYPDLWRAWSTGAGGPPVYYGEEVGTTKAAKAKPAKKKSPRKKAS